MNEVENICIKVLHVIRSINQTTGGPAFAVMQMARTLVETGISVDIATTGIIEREKEELSNNNQFIRDRLRCFYFKKQAGATWSFSWPLWNWLKNNIKNYDVVHITGVFTFPVFIAAVVAKKANIPYIIGPAGTLDAYPLAQKPLRKKLYYKIIIERFIRGAVAIHVTSKREKEQIGLIGITKKCFVIPLGVDVGYTAKTIKENKCLKLLFLSRIHPIKGLPVLLEALSLLKSGDNTFRLTIAGNGSGKYLQEIKYIIKNLGLYNTVTFSGFVEGKVKSELFKEADIFVLPSYHENFGLSVVEALAAGLPVIISNQVAISDEIIKAGAGYVVPVNRPDELANAINSYFKYENRQLASKKAIELVHNKFSVSVLQKNLKSLYCKVSRNSGYDNG